MVVVISGIKAGGCNCTLSVSGDEGTRPPKGWIDLDFDPDPDDAVVIVVVGGGVMFHNPLRKPPMREVSDSSSRR